MTTRSGGPFKARLLAGGDLVGARLGLAMFLAQLLLQFLDRQVDGRVEVRLLIFGKEVIAADSKPDRTLELLGGRMGGVVFLQINPRIDQPAVDMVQFVEL